MSTECQIRQQHLAETVGSSLNHYMRNPLTRKKAPRLYLCAFFREHSYSFPVNSTPRRITDYYRASNCNFSFGSPPIQP
jgi:hypothetical protein